MNNVSEERVRWLKDAGINFVCMPNTSTEALDHYEKYGIGAFVRIQPYWNAWEREQGLTIDELSVDGAYNSFADSFADHPAIWGIDISDEPSAEQFSLLGSLVEDAKILFPNQFIYLNLFPIYASSEQLGTDTYEEHIQTYVDEIDTDYISFDFYNIDLANQKKMRANYFLMRHVENLRIVADACREKDLDMWVILQAGSEGLDEDFLTVKQLNSQLYSSLAFGAQVVNWACWENCWFREDSNMINSNGERTPVYYAVQEVNSGIKMLSPVYMKYKNTDTAFVGNIDHLSGERYIAGTKNLNFFETDGNVFEQDMFLNIQVSSETSTPTILAGSFVKRSGKGEAILFTNLTAFFGEDDAWNKHAISDIETISFTLRDKKLRVVIYYPDVSYVMEPDKNGVYSFELENTEGVFITAEPIA